MRQIDSVAYNPTIGTLNFYSHNQIASNWVLLCQNRKAAPPFQAGPHFKEREEVGLVGDILTTMLEYPTPVNAV